MVVPDLKDILVPLSIVPQTEDVSLEQEETVQNPDIGRKRKSQMSYSVVGRDLRKKRRLNKAQNAPAVRRIQVEEITQEIRAALEKKSERRRCLGSTIFPGHVNLINYYL